MLKKNEDRQMSHLLFSHDSFKEESNITTYIFFFVLYSSIQLFLTTSTKLLLRAKGREYMPLPFIRCLPPAILR